MGEAIWTLFWASAAFAYISLPLQHSDTQFYAEMGIGTPPQRLTFLIDISCDWMWAPSASCQSCSSARSFHKSKSSTFTSLGESETISSAFGEVSGQLSQDVLSLSNAVQSFVLVSEESGYDELVSDGVLGLGLTSQGLIAQLSQQKTVDRATFLLHLGNFNETNDDSQSFLALGVSGFHSRLASTAISLISVSDWSVSISNIEVSGVEILISPSETALFSTLSDSIKVPSWRFADFIQEFAGNLTNCWQSDYAQYVCPCNSTYGDIVLTLGSEKFTVPGQALVRQNWPGECTIAIEESEREDWELGLPFFRAHDVLFDMDRREIRIETDRNSSHSSKFPVWAIAVICALGVCGLLAAILALGCCLRKRKQRSQPSESSLAPLNDPTAVVPVYPIPSAPFDPSIYPSLDD